MVKVSQLEVTETMSMVDVLQILDNAERGKALLLTARPQSNFYKMPYAIWPLSHYDAH